MKINRIVGGKIYTAKSYCTSDMNMPLTDVNVSVYVESKQFKNGDSFVARKNIYSF